MKKIKQWQTMENSPEIFTGYFNDLGYNVEVVDIYDQLQTADALIGIFDWGKRNILFNGFQDSQQKPIIQEIDNACADIAILHSLKNQRQDSWLAAIWKDKTILNNKKIEELHIKYAGKHQQQSRSKSKSPKNEPEEQAFHYVCILKENDHILIFDGYRKNVLSKIAVESLVLEATQIGEMQLLGVTFLE